MKSRCPITWNASQPVSVVELRDALTETAGTELAAALDGLPLSASAVAIEIDSDGGSHSAFSDLVASIRRASSRGCHVTTIAKRAHGVSACVLTVGDSARLEPEGALSFTGAGFGPTRTFRREHAIAIGLGFDRLNRSTAKLMAPSIATRLVSRLRHVEAVRRRSSALTPDLLVRALVGAIRRRLSSMEAKRLLDESGARYGLIQYVVRDVLTSPTSGTREELVALDVALFQRAVASELLWPARLQRRLDTIAVAEITMDFALARDVCHGAGEAPLGRIENAICEALADEQVITMRGASQRNASAESLHRFAPGCRAWAIWVMAVVLAQRLLFGTPHLSAVDAYWLGLVDDIG